MNAIIAIHIANLSLLFDNNKSSFSFSQALAALEVNKTSSLKR
jgi:hypothetical protein